MVSDRKEMVLSLPALQKKERKNSLPPSCLGNMDWPARLLVCLTSACSKQRSRALRSCFRGGLLRPALCFSLASETNPECNRGRPEPPSVGLGSGTCKASSEFEGKKSSLLSPAQEQSLEAKECRWKVKCALHRLSAPWPGRCGMSGSCRCGWLDTGHRGHLLCSKLYFP